MEISPDELAEILAHPDDEEQNKGTDTVRISDELLSQVLNAGPPKDLGVQQLSNPQTPDPIRLEQSSAGPNVDSVTLDDDEGPGIPDILADLNALDEPPRSKLPFILGLVGVVGLVAILVAVL